MCYVKYEAREQVCQSLPDEMLTGIMDIAGEKNNIHWKKKGKELRYKGDMYDVVRKLQIGDTTIYYCYADISESRLISEIDKQVRDYLQDHPQESKKGNDLLKKFMNLYFTQSPFRTFAILFGKEKLYILLKIFYTDAYTGITLPPPKYPLPVYL